MTPLIKKVPFTEPMNRQIQDLFLGLEAIKGPTFYSKWGAKELGDEFRQHGAWVYLDAGGLRSVVFVRVSKSVWEISQLATHVQSLRQGFMRRLLVEIIASVPKGFELWLEVHAQNLGAIRLYESLGFKLKSRRKSYYRDGGDALLYTYGTS
jgi:ribosomal-protein-alanine N-acetyltransferase